MKRELTWNQLVVTYGGDQVERRQDRQRRPPEEGDLVAPAVDGPEPQRDARHDCRDLEPGEGPEPLGPQVVDELPHRQELPERDEARHRARVLARLEQDRHADERHRGDQWQDEVARLHPSLAPRAAKDHVNAHEQVHDQQGKGVGVPDEERQPHDGARARERRPLALGVQGDEQERRQGDRDREVEHPRRDEPAVHHRPREEARHEHAPPPTECEHEPRIRDRSERQHERDEQLRGDAGAGERAHAEQPRVERRVGLEQPVEDELGIEVRVVDDGDGRQVIGQILQRGIVDQQQRPRRESEEGGAQQERELAVRQATHGQKGRQASTGCPATRPARRVKVLHPGDRRHGFP